MNDTTPLTSLAHQALLEAADKVVRETREAERILDHAKMQMAAGYMPPTRGISGMILGRAGSDLDDANAVLQGLMRGAAAMGVSYEDIMAAVKAGYARAGLVTA